MCSHRVDSSPAHFWPVTEWRNVASPSVLPPLMRGIAIDQVDRAHLSERGEALPVNARSGSSDIGNEHEPICGLRRPSPWRPS